MSNRVERFLSAILVICAVVIAGGVARREFIVPAAGAGSPRAIAPKEYVSGWERALGAGIRVGDPSAPVRIVEFADLECPACKRFQGVIHDLLKERPKDVSLVFVHYPLPGHRYGLQAARAVECADANGHFYELVETIFAKQDSLGIKSWGSYAMEAGISDTAQIGSCAQSPLPVRRIESGMALAQKFQILGTPTVLVNGWVFMAPTKENLIRAIEAVRKGRHANEIVD